ncbi:hydrogenase 4 membrane component (E) [Beggiatoa alba B18LD]|uniref:Hydrogenase 4 membrane component (E) n=2 Tax=Beggiatoa alba TaxID=1022 RepID=I3CD80_9GAMM|nr:hydrogenase 4 membrane component (E) [Beggiatoa alba B18LD]
MKEVVKLYALLITRLLKVIDMDLTALSHYEQAILVLSSLVLYTAFALLGQTRILNLINIFAWQGALLSATAMMVAIVSGQHHLYISAVLTFALKVLFIPWLLRYHTLKLDLHYEAEKLAYPSLILLGGVALVIFSYYVVLPIEQLAAKVTRNTIAVSLAIVLLSMLLIISRRQIVSQVVGFMALENGLFFAALVATYGMPMVVELGIAFDVLIAAILFGVFFFHIRNSIDSLDVDRMNRLSEADET